MKDRCRNDHFKNFEEATLVPTKSASPTTIFGRTASAATKTTRSVRSDSTTSTATSTSSVQIITGYSPSSHQRPATAQCKPGFDVKAAPSPALHRASAASTPAMTSQIERPKSVTRGGENSAKTLAIDPLNNTAREPDSIDVEIESKANEGELLKKIASLEETIRGFEAAIDPDRKGLKDEVIYEELADIREKYRDLLAKVKSVEASEAKLRFENSSLETKLANVEKDYAALLQNRDQEYKIYLKALEDLELLVDSSTRANRSAARLIKATQNKDKPWLHNPQFATLRSSPSASPLSQEVSSELKPAYSPSNSKMVGGFGSPSPMLGRKSGTKPEPAVVIGDPFQANPAQLSFGTIRANSSDSSGLISFNHSTLIKRKADAVESPTEDGKEETHGTKDAAVGSTNGESKKARTTWRESHNDDDED